MTGQISSHLAGWPTLVQASSKVLRVRVKFARPLEAQTQNWYCMASAIFSWPNQVTRLVQIQWGGEIGSSS